MCTIYILRKFYAGNKFVVIRLQQSGHDSPFITFQWSEAEQVYPYELTASGNTLYCKQVYLGTMPNGGFLNRSHNIASLDDSKVHRVWGTMYISSSGSFNSAPIPYLSSNVNNNIALNVSQTTIQVYCLNNLSAYDGTAWVIYSK